MIERRRAVLVLLPVLLVLAVGTPSRAFQVSPAEQREIQTGRDAAAQFESRIRVVTDPALNERLRKIGASVAANSQRPYLPYTFKVVEANFVNALAFPGGFIYATTGFLQFVRSDHELAAVLAHEVAHAALGHGMEMMRRANRNAWLILLVAVATRDPNLIQGGSLVAQGLMAGYARDLEQAADLASIDYLMRSPYSPVGVLTVLERLARLEQLSPQPEAAFPNHPRTAERIQSVVEVLQTRGVSLNRRLAANYLAVTVREGTENGAAYAELFVNARAIVRLSDTARIRVAAETLDRLFDSDLEPYEVMVRESQGDSVILARGFSILRLTARDAPEGSGGTRELATVVAARIRTAIDEDVRRRRLEG